MSGDTDRISAARAAGIDLILRDQHEATLARIDQLADARRAAITATHPVIPTDSDPTPAMGIIRPLFAKNAPT